MWRLTIGRGKFFFKRVFVKKSPGFLVTDLILAHRAFKMETSLLPENEFFPPPDLFYLIYIFQIEINSW